MRSKSAGSMDMVRRVRKKIKDSGVMTDALSERAGRIVYCGGSALAPKIEKRGEKTAYSSLNQHK